MQMLDRCGLLRKAVLPGGEGPRCESHSTWGRAAGRLWWKGLGTGRFKAQSRAHIKCPVVFVIIILSSDIFTTLNTHNSPSLEVGPKHGLRSHVPLSLTNSHNGSDYHHHPHPWYPDVDRPVVGLAGFESNGTQPLCLGFLTYKNSYLMGLW